MIFSIGSHYYWENDLPGTYSDYSELKKSFNYFDKIIEGCLTALEEGWIKEDYKDELKQQFETMFPKANDVKYYDGSDIWFAVSEDICYDLEFDIKNGKFEERIVNINILDPEECDPGDIVSIVYVKYDDDAIIKHIKGHLDYDN